jgi:4-hydroxybenzoate polyprenyltransferase
MLRCGSCRFAAFYFLPAYAAMSRDGRSSWPWIAAAVAYWWFLSLATELTNRLGDRTEDEINRPERTALCNIVGFRTIAAVAVTCWVLVLVADVGWVIAWPSAFLATLLLLAAFFGITYTYGPRLKRSRYASLAVLTFPFCGTLLVGWSLGGAHAAHDRTHDLLFSVLPFCIYLGMTIALLAGIKDITDVAGDARIGYKSAWIQLVRSRPEPVVAAVISLPTLLLLILVAGGVFPSRMVFLVLAFPCSWLIALLGRHAIAGAQAASAREAAYTYWLGFLAAALLLYAPSTGLAIAVAGGAAYWLATSRWLHWSQPLSMEKIRGLTTVVTSIVVKEGERTA